MAISFDKYCRSLFILASNDSTFSMISSCFAIDGIET